MMMIMMMMMMLWKKLIGAARPKSRVTTGLNLLFVSSLASVVRCNDHRNETVSIKFPRAQKNLHPNVCILPAAELRAPQPSSIHTGTLFSHDLPKIMSAFFLGDGGKLITTWKDALRNQIWPPRVFSNICPQLWVEMNVQLFQQTRFVACLEILAFC